MSEFWIINCFFEPLGGNLRKEVFEHSSRQLLKQGARLLTVELAFDDAPFILRGEQEFLRVRTSSILWHKERLINLALTHLPSTCEKVAWIDGDLLFEDPYWLSNAAAALDSADVVQLFEKIIHLPRGATEPSDRGVSEKLAMVSQVAKHGKELLARVYIQRALHPVPGGAVAAKKDVLQAGLYDRSIIGGGDDVFMRTLLGAVDLLGVLPPKIVRDVRRWECSLFGTRESFKVSYLPGAIYHLWHGDIENRQYSRRHNILIEEQFDPEHDLEIEENGIYRLRAGKERLAERVTTYFRQRLSQSLAVTEPPPLAKSQRELFAESMLRRMLAERLSAAKKSVRTEPVSGLEEVVATIKEQEAECLNQLLATNRRLMALQACVSQLDPTYRPTAGVFLLVVPTASLGTQLTTALNENPQIEFIEQSFVAPDDAIGFFEQSTNYEPFVGSMQRKVETVLGAGKSVGMVMALDTSFSEALLEVLEIFKGRVIRVTEPFARRDPIWFARVSAEVRQEIESQLDELERKLDRLELPQLTVLAKDLSAHYSDVWWKLHAFLKVPLVTLGTQEMGRVFQADAA